jgi:dynein heavy chain
LIDRDCVPAVVLSQGLPKFMAQIEEVSEYASKEYSLERTLDKMQGK